MVEYSTAQKNAFIFQPNYATADRLKSSPTMLHSNYYYNTILHRTMQTYGTIRQWIAPASLLSPWHETDSLGLTQPSSIDLYHPSQEHGKETPVYVCRHVNSTLTIPYHTCSMRMMRLVASHVPARYPIISVEVMWLK